MGPHLAVPGGGRLDPEPQRLRVAPTARGQETSARMAGTGSLPACPSPEGLAPCQDFLCALLWPVCSLLLIGLCVTWGFLAGFAERCCLGALCLSKPWCCPPHGLVGARGRVGFSVGAGLPEVAASPAASSWGSETESCALGLGRTGHREDSSQPRRPLRFSRRPPAFLAAVG